FTRVVQRLLALRLRRGSLLRGGIDASRKRDQCDRHSGTIKVAHVASPTIFGATLTSADNSFWFPCAVVAQGRPRHRENTTETWIPPCRRGTSTETPSSWRRNLRSTLDRPSCRLR